MKTPVPSRPLTLAALVAATSFFHFQASRPCLAQQGSGPGDAAAVCRGVCPATAVSKLGPASGGTLVLLPKFAETSVTTTVCVPDAGKCLIGGKMVDCGKCDQDGTTCAACNSPVASGTCQTAPCGTCASAAASRLPTGNMPGCASFLGENNQQLAAHREQLARDLVSYLTSRNHSPGHIYQVLQMSLESAANDAHREAMASCNSPGFNVAPAPATASENRTMEELCARLDRQQQRLDRMEEGMFAMARRFSEQFSEPQGSQNASAPDRMPDVVRVPLPLPVAPQTMNPEVQMLRQRVAELESQLSQSRQVQHTSMTGPGMAGGRMGDGVNTLIPASPMMPPGWQPSTQPSTQPTTWNSVPVPARTSSGMPSGSNPVRLMPMVQRTYYVGDLMSPPFASGTLKLMQIIKTTVDPDSWDHASMEIVSPSVSLLISQTEENHGRIEKLLESMRAAPMNR
jgi:uncharacterized coiled-coil protein SlyX